MTLNQFKQLEPQRQYRLAARMMELNRRYLDMSMDIIETRFRYVHDGESFEAYRPTDAKVNRSYDYAESMWEFACRLQDKMR